MPNIIDHTHPGYLERWQASGADRFHGAYYYSREIVSNIIPNVSTDRNWVLVNQHGACFDHSIVFIHNNLHPDHYNWLSDYDDLVLVCGVESTMDKVAHLGRAIYLPLSVDVGYVEQFKTEKDRDTCFIGRYSKSRFGTIPKDADKLCGLPREDLLRMAARYRNALAVGRCAIEARVLGCDILPYDRRYPDPSIWRVIDNHEAAQMLQYELNRIDG